MKLAPLHLLSASYDLSGSDEEWLDRLLALLRPSLDRGLGIYGHLLDVNNLGRLTPEQVRFHGCSEGVRAFVTGPGVPQALAPLVRDVLLSHPAGTSSQLKFPAWHNVYQAMFGGPIVRDTISVSAFDSSELGCLIITPVGEPCRLTPRDLAQLERVSAHIATGCRLRRWFRSRRAEVPELAFSMFDSAGRLVHRVDAGAPEDPTLTLAVGLRARAGARDAGDLRAWTALVEGEWSIVDWSDGKRERYYVAFRNPPALREDRRLSVRQRQILGYLGLGHQLKLIAYELGIAESTVAEHVHAACTKLGVRNRLDLIRIGRELLTGREQGDAPVPACQRSSALSSAERQVADLAARGFSDRDIATVRGTSVRTVANQLRSAFRRLGVRSRAELVAS